MSAGWQERFRARVAMYDLAAAGEQIVGGPDAALHTQEAQATAVLEAIGEAPAEGIPEAEIDAELAAYRTEQFTLEKFLSTTALVAADRKRRYPELGGRGWATLPEVSRQAGVEEGLARARYEQALEEGLVRDVEAPEAARTHGPTFAPGSGRDV